MNSERTSNSFSRWAGAFSGWGLVACACILALGATDAFAQAIQTAPSSAVSSSRDKAAEDLVAKSLTQLLADQKITGLHRYNPPLLSEGVCSSIHQHFWVNVMRTDEGPQALYQTSDVAKPSNDLRKLVTETSRFYNPMSRFAVAVWKEKTSNGSDRYWVGVVLAKSAVSDWFGSHLGADTPKELVSPNHEAVRDVLPECRNK